MTTPIHMMGSSFRFPLLAVLALVPAGTLHAQGGTAYLPPPDSSRRLAGPLTVPSEPTPAAPRSLPTPLPAPSLSPLRRLLARASRHGLGSSAQLTADLSTFGGAEGAALGRLATRGRSLSTVTVGGDLDSLLGLRGGRLSAVFHVLGGPDQTATLAAAHGGTSIDAAPFWGAGELWYEQTARGGALRLKAGRLDANTEFAVAQHAAGFLSPSAGLDPTIFPMPTYPTPALGANAFVRLARPLRLGVGVYDGRPAAAIANGTAPGDEARVLFGIGELELGWGGATRPGRIAAGAWRHGGSFPADGPTPSARAHGTYAVADQTLWSGATRGGTREVGAYVQLGWTGLRVSDVGRHVGVGLAATGPFASRPDDGVGVGLSALTLGRSGATARGAPVGAREEMVELYYALRVASWLTLVPDVDVKLHAGGRHDRAPATALTLRTVITR